MNPITWVRNASTHFHVSLGLVAGVAVGLFLLFQFGGNATAAFDNWLNGAVQEVKTAKLERARTAKWKSAAAAEHNRAIALAADTASKRSQLDKLAARLLAVPDTAHLAQQYIDACHAILLTCEQRAQAWQHADSLDKLRADTAEAHQATADSIIAAGVKVRSCTFLHFFGCPTRTQTFEAGGILGAVLTFVLTRH
jgi:hypothetical protein